MLLGNFACNPGGKQPQCHVFDKWTGRTFQTAIKNVAVERDFNEFEGQTSNVESILSQLETETTQVFKKLLDQRRLDAITPEDAAWAAAFVGTQFLRAKNFREAAKALNAAMEAKLRTFGANPDQVKGWRSFKNEDEVKEFSFVMLAKVSGELTKTLFAKQWVLFETTEDQPFWISDNPVVLHNDLERDPALGNIGFAVPGIQVYLPLGPTLVLGMWCWSHADYFRNAARDSRASLERTRSTMSRAVGAEAFVDRVVLREMERRYLGKLDETVAAIETGRPMKCSPGEVMFFNSLQVLYADRQLYSFRNDFGIAEQMIAANPDRRRGARMTV